MSRNNDEPCDKAQVEIRGMHLVVMGGDAAERRPKIDVPSCYLRCESRNKQAENGCGRKKKDVATWALEGTGHGSNLFF